MSKTKKIILVIMLIILLIGIFGITYAIFSYTGLGNNEELITGDIYMHYKESNTLTLSNAMPSSTFDSNTYFEFTIDGKNTNTKYDIYYDINLLRGDVPDGKQEANRILDKFIKFRLTEFIDGVETEIFTNKSYSDLSTAKRVHVATINKNTTTEVIHRYRLYAWISNRVKIGNSENPDKDYDQLTWNNLFASIKVRATGDFTEKEIDIEPTEESCFTSTTTNNEVTITGYDNTCGADVVIPSKINGNPVKVLSQYSFSGKQLTSVVIPEGVTTIDNFAFPGNNLTTIKIPSSVKTIGENAFSSNQLQNLTIESDEILIGRTSFANNKLQSLKLNVSNLTVGESAFASNQLQNLTIESDEILIGRTSFVNNKITDVSITSNLITFGTASFSNNKITSLAINNNSVSIGDNAFTNNNISNLLLNTNNLVIGREAFENNSLTNIEINAETASFDSHNIFYQNNLDKTVKLSIPNIPNNFMPGININSLTLGDNVKAIGEYAFISNKLTSLNIPENLETINQNAFAYNQLENIDFSTSNSLNFIGDTSFMNNKLTELQIPHGNIYIGRFAFQNNNLINITIGIRELVMVTGHLMPNIQPGAFFKGYYNNSNNNSNLSSIKFFSLNCEQIKSLNYYPWLTDTSPYYNQYSTGVTIYDKDDNICDAF